MKSKFLKIPPGDVIDLSKVVYVRSHRYQRDYPFYLVKLSEGGDALTIYETENGYKHQLYHEQFGRVMYMPREEFLQHLMNWELNESELNDAVVIYRLTQPERPKDGNKTGTEFEAREGYHAKIDESKSD